MKTRVIKRYVPNNGTWVFWVQKWDEHDASDLREAGRQPNPPFLQFDWRWVRAYPNEDEATAVARRIAEHGKDPRGVSGINQNDEYEVVEEFGA